MRMNHVTHMMYHLTPRSFKYSFILVSFSITMLPRLTTNVNINENCIMIGRKKLKSAFSKSFINLGQ